MISYQDFFDYLQDSPLEHWLETLPSLIEEKLDPARNRNLIPWVETLDSLPQITPSTIDLNTGCIQIGTAEETPEDLERLL